MTNSSKMIGKALLFKKATVYKTPPTTPAPKAVNVVNLLTEWRIAIELTRLPWNAWPLFRIPKGKGTVILIPGWLSPEIAMSPLRAYLSSKGYDARHWGLGTNEGHPVRDTKRLMERIKNDPSLAGQKLSLVGWSLGGVIAREIARMMPDRISGVVTYGSPVVGGPTYTPAADMWGPEACASLARRAAEVERLSPIQVPVAVIFSKRDEVVSWPACIDRNSPLATHYEVDSPHIAMGIDPSVWLVIGEKLAEYSR